MTKREQRRAEKEAEEAAAKECGREAVGLIDRTMLHRLLVAGQVLLKYRVHRKRNVKKMNAQGAQEIVVEDYYEEIGAGKGDVDDEVLADEPCYRIDPQCRYWRLVVEAIPEVTLPACSRPSPPTPSLVCVCAGPEHVYQSRHFPLTKTTCTSGNHSFPSYVRLRAFPTPPMSWIC